MRINKYKPHILVLPEDDANRQMANGFLLEQTLNQSAIQVLPPAGGWKKVVEDFKTYHVGEMQKYSHRMMVLLMDFDERENRFSYVENQIPNDLKERVFILGVKSEPEKLKKATERTLEGLGEDLAKDCSENKNELWGHELLKHNSQEIHRMISSVKPYLFPNIPLQKK
jgi:hypothetical protein